MRKKIVYLMCKNIAQQSVNLDEMINEDPDKAIHFIHSQYIFAHKEYNRELAQIQSGSL